MDARVIWVGVNFAVGLEIGLIIRVIAKLGESKARSGLAEAINDLIVIDAAEIGCLRCSGCGDAIDDVPRVHCDGVAFLGVWVDAWNAMGGEEALGVCAIGAACDGEQWRGGKVQGGCGCCIDRPHVWLVGVAVTWLVPG